MATTRRKPRACRSRNAQPPSSKKRSFSVYGQKTSKKAKLTTHTSTLEILPAEIRNSIYSYCLPSYSSAIRYKTFHGKHQALREGQCEGGKFKPSYQYIHTLGPLSQVCKRLRHEYLFYFWSQKHLFIDDIYDLRHFKRDYPNATKAVRTLSLVLSSHTRAYGGTAKDRIETMSFLYRTFINLTELNLCLEFQNWTYEERGGGDDDFRRMPFFLALEPFPKLQIFRLLASHWDEEDDDEEDSEFFVNSTSPFSQLLPAIEDWMKAKLIATQTSTEGKQTLRG